MTSSPKQRALTSSSPPNAVIVKLLSNFLLANVKTFSGKAADIWALGVTFYSLIYNELPFWSDTEIGILEAIHKTE